MSDNDTKEKLSAVLAELKAEYLVALPQKIERLKFHTDNEDWENLSEEYHKIKGTGKTYGYPEISIIAEKLEGLAKAKETQLPPLFQQALSLLERIRVAYANNQKFNMDEDQTVRTILSMKDFTDTKWLKKYKPRN